MSINDLFWLFFVFTALQPVLRQRMLEAMRTRKIAQLERQRSSRVILLVHRQETMRLLGFPLMRYIDIGDSEEVLRARPCACSAPDRPGHTRAQSQSHCLRAALRDVGRYAYFLGRR